MIIYYCKKECRRYSRRHFVFVLSQTAAARAVARLHGLFIGVKFHLVLFAGQGCAARGVELLGILVADVSHIPLSGVGRIALLVLPSEGHFLAVADGDHRTQMIRAEDGTFRVIQTGQGNVVGVAVLIALPHGDDCVSRVNFIQEAVAGGGMIWNLASRQLSTAIF